MNHDQQHQNHPVSWSKHVNGHFIATTGRYIVSFLCGALLSAYTIGGKAQDLSNLLKWQGQVQVTLDRMDNDGTRASKWRIDQEIKDEAAMDVRIKLNEEAAKKIDTMISKIEELKIAVAELKSQKK